MKLNTLSVKQLFSRVAMGLVLSMSGIAIALFLVTKQAAVRLTGGALLLCALVGIFVLTLIFGKRLSLFTADLCQTLDYMIAGNEAPQPPGGQRNPAFQNRPPAGKALTDHAGEPPQGGRGTAGVTDPCIGYFPSGKNAGEQSENGDGHAIGKAHDRGGAHRLHPGNPHPDG